MEGRNNDILFTLRFISLVFLSVLLLTSCATSQGPIGAGSFRTVIIDAGHGGSDNGARAVSGFPEKVVALDTARRLASVLRSKKLSVIETRSDGYFVPLDRRVAIANAAANSIFVSVHYNWSRRRSARGEEIYFYSPQSQRLAANILRELNGAYPTNNRGVKRNDYYVLRNNRRPAVLCELGFLSNPADNRSAQDPACRQRLAECIAAGIIAEKQGRRP